MALQLSPESIDRFKQKHSKGFPDDCWLWWGNLIEGFGVYKVGNSSHRAHRVAYEIYKEPIPEKHSIKHTCSNKACVNPEHMAISKLRKARVGC